MDPVVYLAFVVAAAVVITAPGPSVMVVVASALADGLSRSFSAVAGVAVSHALFFACAAFGLTALLLASAALFAWVERELFSSHRALRLQRSVTGSILIGAGAVLAAAARD